jgi:hypothetical protein
MSRTPKRAIGIDALGLACPSSNSNSAYQPAQTAGGSPGKILVPRRQADAVSLSQESCHDEESASALCSNFMAAWG